VNKNTETLSFSPINGAHAITEMVVYIQFTPELALQLYKDFVVIDGHSVHCTGTNLVDSTSTL
jgi:hypothetical protein